MKKKRPTYEITPRRGMKNNTSFFEWVKLTLAGLFAAGGVATIILFWLVCALAPVAACIAIVYYCLTH